jgi:hypothetical protein
MQQTVAQDISRRKDQLPLNAIKHLIRALYFFCLDLLLLA